MYICCFCKKTYDDFGNNAEPLVLNGKCCDECNTKKVIPARIWTITAKEILESKTIKEVRYLNDEEMNMMGWDKRPICFFLDNGESCVISCDDEGNNGGVLFYGEDGVLPTL